MPTITLSMPTELKQEMDLSKDINWSEVAREAIKQKLNQLKILKTITSKSKLSKEDALELGKMINKSLSENY